MIPRHRVAPLAALLLALGTQPLAGQEPSEWDTRRVYMTRPQLEALLARLDSVARSRGASGGQQAQALRDAAPLRQRLADGDFQAGDRVLLRVDGEQQLSDTFTVEEGRLLRLPNIGDVPLTGVLRAELEDHVRTRLATFIKNPVVRARPLIRIGVMGEVSRPGFYLVAPTSQVEDAVMAAAGATQNAKLSGIVVQRTDGEEWKGAALQQAMAAGRTLDELGIRSGDRFFVPRRGDASRTVAILAAVVTIPATIFAITRLAR